MILKSSTAVIATRANVILWQYCSGILTKTKGDMASSNMYTYISKSIIIVVY